MKLSIRPSENEVKGRRLVGCHFRYFLDDYEVTNSLTELKLEMSAEDVNRATLTFLIDDLEVDAEAMAALKAKVKLTEREQRRAEVLGSE